MRKFNHSIASIASMTATAGARDFLSLSEEKRFSADILQAMSALTCLAAAQVYGILNPSQSAVMGLLYLIGILIVGIPTTITAVRGFLREELCSSMEILVTIAMLVSVLDGRYAVAILIPLLLALVHFLEEKSIVGGRDAIEGLKKMQSDTAIRLENGVQAEVPAGDLSAGDVILVKPGMGFPIDGKVLAGESSVNQQSLTGEALPCDVKPGDSVYAGTLNMQGVLTVEVEKTCQDTSFHKIVKILEEVEKSATPESRMADRFMAYYIPLILAAAVLVWLFTRQADRALAILVVSCPCGHMLVSSAPLIASLGAAARRGVLIKNAEFIENLARVDAVFFDKTGTLTSGEIVLRQCVPAEGVSEETLYGTALSAARHSAHPVSKAIASRADMPYMPDEPDFTVTERAGMGLVGLRGEETILLGSEALLSSFGVRLPEGAGAAEIAAAATSVHVVRNGRFLGTLVFSDALRGDAPRMIAALKRLGIKETCLLTGDKSGAAERIREACAIDAVRAQILPEQKQQIVREARNHRRVAFVGDGINDTLALSEADVGIAVAGAGSDTAIQSADIVLTGSCLDNIPFVIGLARRTRELIRQNIAIAFLSSLVLISLAACGVVTALSGAVLHNAGAFIVLLNSARGRTSGGI
ncbi:MAG: heavy metal translocating P-type ATPase [Synergistaceae bacterium]|jgi:Cd2+/Zn2+-exporting ATPase/Cu+-exporting ATPase|nr:heavy metal translocating P-type ATPase [Synergistaceae bacterium]